MSVCLSGKQDSVILYIVEQIGCVNNCDYVERNGLYISVYICMHHMCVIIALHTSLGCVYSIPVRIVKQDR